MRFHHDLETVVEVGNILLLVMQGDDDGVSGHGSLHYSLKSDAGCQLPFGNYVPLDAPNTTGGWQPGGLFLQFQLRLVVLEKRFDFLGCAQQAIPLLIVKGDREAAETVNADPSLFTDLENQIAAAFLDFDF